MIKIQGENNSVVFHFTDEGSISFYSWISQCRPRAKSDFRYFFLSFILCTKGHIHQLQIFEILVHSIAARHMSWTIVTFYGISKTFSWSLQEGQKYRTIPWVTLIPTWHIIQFFVVPVKLVSAYLCPFYINSYGLISQKSILLHSEQYDWQLFTKLR